MSYAAAYLTALIAFGVLDLLWLGTMANALYRPTLGDILLDDLRLGPALLFYALYPVGLVIFAVSPAFRSGMLTTALIQGALFGAFAYATYDLTNYATLRNWTLQITVVDILYGAALSGIVATVSYLIARSVSQWTAS
jgi:uncharacterized membrane protein